MAIALLLKAFSNNQITSEMISSAFETINTVKIPRGIDSSLIESMFLTSFEDSKVNEQIAEKLILRSLLLKGEE